MIETEKPEENIDIPKIHPFSFMIGFVTGLFVSGIIIVIINLIAL